MAALATASARKCQYFTIVPEFPNFNFPCDSIWFAVWLYPPVFSDVLPKVVMEIGV